MTLDPRLAALLQREFQTIRTVRDPAFERGVAQAKAELTVQGAGQGSSLVFAVDRRCAQEYMERSNDYLSRALERLTDLRQVWTERLRMETEALLLGEMAKDRNYLVEFRDKALGTLKNHGSGQLSAAENTSRRKVEEELAFRVLREEKRKLPLDELLAAPRYEAVRRHWDAANGLHEESTSQSAELTREAVFALEALARLAVGDPAATLGHALQTLRVRTDDAGRHLLASIEKVWNFSNTAPSTRHGGGSGDEVSAPEAQFVLGVAGEGLRLLLTFDLG